MHYQYALQVTAVQEDGLGNKEVGMAVRDAV